MKKSTFSPAYEAVKAKLKALRKTAGLTQRALAEKLGREPSFVARIEQGERRLDVVEFVWVCQALGARPEQAAVELIRSIRTHERAAHQGKTPR